MRRAAVFNLTIFVITVIMFLSFSNAASAQAVYGCAKDEIVMFNPGQCPVCSSQLSIVKEGYINNSGKVLLDTFSEQEKKDAGIKEDFKFLVVVYKSSLGQASFSPGKDKAANTLERNILELKYACDGMLSPKRLSDKCKRLGDLPGTKEGELEERLKNLEAIKRAQMKRELEESRSIFYKRQKDAGLSDIEIQFFWEKEQEKVYEKYGYDPKADTFANLEIPKTGGEQ